MRGAEIFQALYPAVMNAAANPPPTRRRTKIVATLGPASSDFAMIEKLALAGVDVFRLNFSHGDHATHRQTHHNLRAVEEKIGRPIAILADLQGPKLRIGVFAEKSVELHPGAQFCFDSNPAPGDSSRVYLPHREIFAATRPGAFLLLDDGKIRMRILACDETTLQAEIIAGGALSDRKGLHVPDCVLPIAAMTEKDRKDLDFALSLGVDWVALSFVQRASDVESVRDLLLGRAAIMVKLEKRTALEHLPAILQACDALMVARGDLGVEMPPEEVPFIQKQLVTDCRRLGKPVVIATQMLESMIHTPVPTRAEASDVATAVYDGADAVMLSAESAAGLYPLQAVTMMKHIIERVENAPNYDRLLHNLAPDQDSAPVKTSGEDAITGAAKLVSDLLLGAAIVTYTTSGSTAVRASCKRPLTPILGLTPKQETARRLALVWGVHPVLTEDAVSVPDMVTKAIKASIDKQVVKSGECIIITAGVPFGTPGATNLLHFVMV